MFNDVVDAICLALSKEFADKEIYTEQVKQGFSPPCFFVVCINPNEGRFLGDKFQHKGKYEVNYFPNEENANRELVDVSETLSDILETIEVKGELTRGTKMESTISDGVLSFLVNYDYFVYKSIAKEEAMEKLQSNTEVENG
jgi:hypothetical protein